VAFSSCEYVYIVPDKPDPGDTISFSKQIIPIFKSDCISCHNTGGTDPDLTENNAYNSIISDGLTDTNDPESSILYDFPHPDTGTHTWKKYTKTQADLILFWIQQGAKNN
jgi:hypothetical protein